MEFVSRLWIIIVSIIVISCGSSGKKKSTKGQQDSLHQSASVNDTTPKPAGPPLAAPGSPPGECRVKGQLVSLHPSHKKPGGTLKLKVIQVLGTGSSTPLVSAGDTLWIQTSAWSDSLKKGGTIIGRIHHREVVAKFKNKSPQWVLIKTE